MSARRPKGRRSESEAPHWRPRELPFYAADDTRLHWVILAGCMVSKRLIKGAAWGLTGVFRSPESIVRWSWWMNGLRARAARARNDQDDPTSPSPSGSPYSP